MESKFNFELVMLLDSSSLNFDLIFTKTCHLCEKLLKQFVDFLCRFSQLQDSRPEGSASDIGADGPRKYVIGGNWKCNGTWDENADRVAIFNEAGPIPSNVEVALCVPDINIPQLLSTLRSDIAVGAQNCGINTGNGAFTGETGSHQLKALGVVWTIVGHSERREGFGMAGETVEVCAKKCKVALDNGLKVMFVSIILCIAFSF